MPSNRRSQPEAKKRTELVAAARALFVRDGYETTSMSRIAQAAGVTPNTIYWYFADKEGLLIAVLDDILQEAVAGYAKIAQSPLEEQLLWFINGLQAVSGLVTTVHNRLRESPVLDQWHSGFHAMFETLIASRLPKEMPRKQREAEARIVAYAVEGAFTHGLGRGAARQLCVALAERLATAAPQNIKRRSVAA